MKRIARAYKALLAALLGLPWVVAQADDPQLAALSLKYGAATVFLEAESGGKAYPLGTGVVISEQGHVLTAHHIFTVENCPVCETATFYARVGQRDADRVKLERNGDDSSYDVAMLRLQGPGPWTKAPVRKLDNPRPGKSLIIMGFPNAERFNAGRGYISNPDFSGGRWRADLPVMEGNSGGPVFDEDGYLVGLVQGGIQGERLKTVIPIEHGKYYLQIAKVDGAAKMPDVDRPGSIPVYIDIANIIGYSPMAVDSLKASIARVGGRLRNIQLTAAPEQAKYWLSNLSLESDGLSGLLVRGTFRWAETVDDSVFGSCAECEDDKNGPMQAFVDLLHKTLFHPTRGPYGMLAIKSCEQENPLAMILGVTWRSGPGLESGLHYEIAQLKNGRATMSNYYLKYDELLSRAADTAEARFLTTASANSTYSIASCGPERSNVSEVLVTRLLPRLLPGTGRNASPRNPR